MALVLIQKVQNNMCIQGNYGIMRKPKALRVYVKAKASYDIVPALVGSAAAYTIGYPLDTIKTRLQSNNYHSKTIHDNLFYGYSYGVLMCMASAGSYFLMYKYLLQMLGADKTIVCSMIATFMSCFVKVPCKSIIKVMQNNNFKHITDATNLIVATFGVWGFYKGFWLYAMDDVPENALKFFLFEFLQTFISVNWLVGALAGFVTSVATQPFDVLQTKIICQNEKSACLKPEESFKGLWLKLVIETLQAATFLRFYKAISGIHVLP